MKKRLFSGLLAFVLLFSLIPTTALAADTGYSGTIVVRTTDMTSGKFGRVPYMDLELAVFSDTRETNKLFSHTFKTGADGTITLNTDAISGISQHLTTGVVIEINPISGTSAYGYYDIDDSSDIFKVRHIASDPNDSYYNGTPDGITIHQPYNHVGVLSGGNFSYTLDLFLGIDASLGDFSVEYLPGEGATGSVTDSNTYGYGSAITLASGDGLSKTGYAFAGWSDGATTYAAGTSVYNYYNLAEYNSMKGKLSLTAQWTANTYTIAFDGLEDITSEAPSNISATYDVEYTLPAAPTKTGYTFTGWKLDDKIYSAGATVKNLTAENGATVTLTVEWSKNTEYVAEIVGGGEYETLQEAIDAAENNDTVKLLKSVSISNAYNGGNPETIKVSTGKVLTLDLNGNTISQHIEDNGLSIAAVAVYSGASLTVVDTSIAGTGKISGSNTAIQLEGTLNLAGGTISVENPSNTDKNPDKGWAFCVWVYMRSKDAAKPVFNMTGGELNICEEMLSAHSKYDYANAIAFGDGVDGIAEYYRNATVSISNGFIEGTLYMHKEADVSITGGTFSADPTKYLTANLVAVKDSDDYYVLREAKKKVSVEDPDVTIGSNVAEQDKQTLAEVAGGTKIDLPEVEVSLDMEAVSTAVNSSDGLTVDEDEKITVYVQTYLDIGVTEYSSTDGTLTLDITPMVQVVAATTENANEIDLVGADKNAVKVGAAQEIEINSSVTITIPLPSGFAQDGATLYIKHTKDDGTVHYYEGTVVGGKLTFVNPHGFSQFGVLKSSPFVAEIDGEKYADLQTAITDANADADKTTITLLQDVTVKSKIDVTSDITLDLNGKTISYMANASRMFYILGGCTEFTIDGTDANSAIVIPETAPGGATGLVDIQTAAHVTINGGEYRGNTNRGSFFKQRNASGATLELNNITVATNWRVVDVAVDDSTGDALSTYAQVTVTGGTYTVSEKEANSAFLLAATGAGDSDGYNIKFTAATITTACAAVEVSESDSKALFTNCDITVTTEGTGNVPGAPVTTSDGASATIVSGTYSATGTGKYSVYALPTGGTINITGGTFTGDVMAHGNASNAVADSAVNISGSAVVIGTLVVKDASSSTGTNVEIKVSGGNFSETVPDKYLSSELNTELYDTAKKSNAPYSYYSSPEAAAAAAVGEDAVIKNAVTGETIPVEFTVTFDANGGTPTPEKQTVKLGEKATKPADPVNGEYTFSHWALDGAKYDFDAKVTGNIALEAVWVHDCTDVKDDNGRCDICEVCLHGKTEGDAYCSVSGCAHDEDCMCHPDPTRGVREVTIKAVLADGTPAAEVPVQIYVNPNNGEAHYAIGTVVKTDANGEVVITDALDETGIFDALPYGVTIYCGVVGDGWDWETTHPVRTVYGPYLVNAGPVKDSTGNGYVWLTAGEGVGFSANFTCKVKQIGTVTPPVEPEPTKYTVKYTDGVAGAVIFADQTTEVESGATTPAFNGTPTRDGYTFKGWNPAVADTVTGNVTYVAQWEEVVVTPEPEPEPTKYTVIYTDGVVGEVIFADQTSIVSEGSVTPAFNGTPTRDGYTFKGWNPAVADTVTGNVTYVAQWEEVVVTPEPEPVVTYTITFVANGGELADGSESLSYVVKAGTETLFVPQNPVRDGYTFKGWMPTIETPVTEDATYYAKWQRNYVDVYYPEYDSTPVVKVKGLNTKDHIAYIVGIGNGLVNPLGTITRAEAATIFFRLMEDDFRNEYWSNQSSYADVSGTDWYNVAVSTLEAAGIIQDCATGGNFRPKDPITRAELAVMAAQFTSVSGGRIPQTSFTDVNKDHWAYDEISLVEYAGWIEGWNSEFRPDDNMNRAECMTIVNRMLQRGAEAKNMLSDMVTFTDNVYGSWYYEAVQEATNSHTYVRTVAKLTGEDFRGEKWVKIEEAPDWVSLEKAWAEQHKE